MINVLNVTFDCPAVLLKVKHFFVGLSEFLNSSKFDGSFLYSYLWVGTILSVCCSFYDGLSSPCQWESSINILHCNFLACVLGFLFKYFILLISYYSYLFLGFFNYLNLYHLVILPLSVFLSLD